MKNLNRLILTLLSILRLSASAAAMESENGDSSIEVSERMSSLYQQVSSETGPERMMRKNVFTAALKSYCVLMDSPQSKTVANPNHLTIVDFDQPSLKKRFYVYDIKQKRIIENNWTTQGVNSDFKFYLRLTDTDIPSSLFIKTLNEPIVSYRAAGPEFFSDLDGSKQTSVGMAVAAQKYHPSPEFGKALRIIGIDGGLNQSMVSRKVIVHGFKYSEATIKQEGVPTSEGCLMNSRSENSDIMAKMLGSPVFLFHRRLDQRVNEEMHQAQLQLLENFNQQIETNWSALVAKYRWSDQIKDRNMIKLKQKLIPIAEQVENTYQYFKNNPSAYYGKEPTNAERCLQRVGI